MTDPQRPKLIVLGTGFGAFSLARKIQTGLFDVTIVSPRNHFLFTPLLPSTTVGTIEFRSIIEPIRTACPDVTYYQADCTTVRPDQRSVACRAIFDGRKFDLPYDYLVIAVGAVSNTYGIPGVMEHAHMLKDIADARTIRQQIIDRFEQAAQPEVSEEERRRLLHFAVVGGGPTGVEFAAEMHDFLQEDLRAAFPALVPYVSITLLEAAGEILNSFDETLRDYTLRVFERRHIAVRTGSVVVRVEKERIVLRDGFEIPYGLVVWSTGIGATQLVLSLPFPKDASNRLLTDRFFRLKGMEREYAIGDCAVVEGENFPATAQVAQQEGAYLAQQFNRLARGRQPRRFVYRHYGMLAYIGGGRALADLARFKGKGFTTWLFWRSAYLTKLVSLKNKMLVLFDWFKAFVFGRDISRF